MNFNKKELYLTDVGGAGGGKSGGSGGSESPDTIQTNEIIKILLAVGEGEINLYDDGSGELGRSIFLNNTPLVNSDGSYNFGAWNQTDQANVLYTGGGSTYWEWRNGAPSQSLMTNPAFPSATAIFSVNQEVLGGTSIPLLAPAPVTYSVSAANVAYCKVAIQFPDGIVNVDGNGNIVGDSVEFTLSVKPRSSGSWTQVDDIVINAKSDNAAVVQYQVNNPNPGSLWDIQINRITQDNSTATRKNEMYLDTVEECQSINLPYNGIALLGLALDASTIGGQNASIPTMSVLVTPGAIPIPNNFNPATNTYAGTWNLSSFTTGVTDDPAWILTDLLINTQYGGGIYGITSAMIDWGSFWNASKFNNQMVSDGNGGMQPRFTFNAPIQNRQDFLTSMNQVAQMMNANLGVVNGLITLFQDRPVSSLYLINKSRVVGSDSASQGAGANPVYFKYASNMLSERYTAVNVTWVNESNIQWLPSTTTVKDATYLAKYGYNATDISAFGATTYGQAHRAAKYWLYENLYNNEQVEFEMGLEGFISEPDDVFDLYDDDYAGRAVGGRIVSATSNTATLDQPVIIDPSVTSYLWVLAADGVTYSQHTITNSPGTYSTLSISGTFTTIPSQYCPYGVTSAIAPRQFKIKDIKIDGTTQTATITAKLYSNTNYTYVEGTWTQPTAVYTQPTQSAALTPTNIAATPTQYINPQNGHLQYGVSVAWDRPSIQNISYVIKWRKDNGQYTTTASQVSNNFVLEPIVDGTYYFLVYSINILGQQSAPASVTYTLNTAGGSSSSTLSEITNLVATDSGSTTWNGLDCHFNWTNPSVNQGLLKDFVVTIKNGGTTLRQVVCPPVIGGAVQSYVYTYAMNFADTNGSPVRALTIKVQGRDSQNNTTTGITATLTNAAPAVPSNITAVPGMQNAIITWTPETDIDVSGYYVWFSTTNGFTPGSGNVNDCGSTAIFQANNLTKGTTYYYRIAAYDVFGKSSSGTGLNVSSQLSTATPTNIGVPSGPTLPSSGMILGDLYFDTTDNTIYRYTGSAWTNATDGSTINPASITTSQIAAGTILGSNIAAGTITGGNIVAGTITTSLLAAGSVTTSILAAGAVTAAKITANTITASQIAAGTITGTEIAANSITSAHIVSGTIVSSDIAASTITAGNLNISTLSAITANVGTLTAGSISNNSGTNVINLVGSSRVDLQACKLEYSIVSPK